MNTGIFKARVQQNNDPEKRGRIRVEYPWFQDDSADLASEWADVCSSYASKDAGLWILPEVGDEVFVYLENGNLDHPVVLGSVYNKQQLPPQVGREGDLNSNNKNDLKHLRTRSGHTICLDDSESGRGLYIQGQKRLVISDFENNQITVEAGEITIETQRGDKVSLNSGGVTIHSQTVKIEAAQSLELGVGATEALVKGQSFMALFNAHTHTSGMPGSPTSPPVAPMTPDLLSTKVKTA